MRERDVLDGPEVSLQKDERYEELRSSHNGFVKYGAIGYGIVQLFCIVLVELFDVDELIALVAMLGVCGLVVYLLFTVYCLFSIVVNLREEKRKYMWVYFKSLILTTVVFFGVIALAIWIT